MNELQKEYFERLAREEAEAEAKEEARLKAFMEEERRKDEERKAKEEQAKLKKEEADRIAAEEADRKAEDEAAESIIRMNSKITEDRKKEKEAEAKKDAKADKTTEAEGETQKEAKPEAVKEVVKPAADGTKKAASPKFKKGGKKGTAKVQTNARPKPEEAGALNERPKKPEEEQKDSEEALKDETKQQTAVADETKQQTAVADEAKNQTEVENLEGTVEDTEPEENAGESESTDGEPTVKASPEAKAAADKEAKWKEAIEESQDKYKRMMAEIENARAREAKEAAQKYDLGAKSVLEKLLPIVDNFERAIQMVPEEDKERAFEQGVDKIYKQMMTVLEDIGVTPMNAEGTEFNPDLHNAVMHVEDDAYGENVVAEEMQKGYMYKDTVLRYSMVKVAN